VQTDLEDKKKKRKIFSEVKPVAYGGGFLIKNNVFTWVVSTRDHNQLSLIKAP